LNAAIEFHDSECLALEVDSQGGGSVLLNAYVHRTVGEPGISPGEGGVQRVRLKVGAMRVIGDVGDLPASIYDGSIVVGTSALDVLIPFPSNYSEAVSITLTLLDNAREIVVSGVGLSIEAESEFKFVEDVDLSTH
jgi:hypothetical protein